MKDLEKLFKDSLQNHEMPYDASAWNSLSQKMTTPKKPFYKKGWFYGAVAAVAVGTVGGIVISSNQDVAPKKEISVNQPEKKTSISPTIKKSKTTDSQSEVENIEIDKTPNAEVKDASITIDRVKKEKTSEDVVQLMPEEIKEDQTITSIKTTSNTHVATEQIDANFSMNTNAVCAGDIITITLPEENSKFQEYIVLNGKKQPVTERILDVVAKGSLMEVEYIVQAENTKESSLKTVAVKAAEVVDIQYSTFTEDGMPLTHFTTTLEKPIWKIDGKVVSRQKEFKHLFIHKGRYEVSVESSSQNVCADVYTEVIQIEEEYRLFAETGMSLSSSDSRLNSFMPFALKEMDNPNFFLTVLDAKTGQQLYTTNNANEPWDGTNPSTGNKIEPGSIIFWTVIIKDNQYIQEPIKGDITILK